MRSLLPDLQSISTPRVTPAVDGGRAKGRRPAERTARGAAKRLRGGSGHFGAFSIEICSRGGGMEQWAQLGRRELQALVKQRGGKANQKVSFGKAENE